VEEPNEAAPVRIPQPRWIGLVIIIAAVVMSLTVLPAVRGQIKRFIGV
jgi:hypothetical protein